MGLPNPPSQLEIVNLALGHLKQRKISSMTEVSVQAQAVNRCYETARRETLRGHDWSFATCVKTLALLANYTPTSNWLYAYQYPANAVAVWHVYDDTTVNKTAGDDFRELYDDVNNQKVLVCNIADAIVEYTFDLSDTTLFDSTFVTAFAYRLAADMAPGLTGDDAIADNMMKKALVAISEAERYSAYENTQVKDRPTSEYEDVRGGSFINEDFKQ